MSRRKQLARGAQLAIVAAALFAQPVLAEPGQWTVTSDVSPLTDLPQVAASLPSVKPLHNMLGDDQPASLVLRCRDRVLAAYIGWPEVVHASDGDQALALWKLNQGPIKADYWRVSETGTGVGAFESRAAGRLIGTWRGAHRLVVRLSGQTIQDAEFDLTGIDEVATRVLTTCGVAAAPAATGLSAAGPAPSFSAGTSIETTAPAGTLLAVARRLLEGRGFRIVAGDAVSTTLGTEPLEMHLTTREADCGRSFGIPYLADHRAHSSVSYRIIATPGHVTVSTAIGGIYKGAVGVHDSPLRCTSRGILEAQFASDLKIALQ